MPANRFKRLDVTGLVLAGGRGSRMGGVDKGLQLHKGQALARHALERLAPQVGSLMVNANRHLDAYRSWGWPVCPDASGNFEGPLAGFLAGLALCKTSYLITVPCDTPNFPEDLVARLLAHLQRDGSSLAIAATLELERGLQQPHPVFCLMHVDLAGSLATYLQSGQRKIERWCSQQACSTVLFDNADAFFNANTIGELAQLQVDADGATRPPS